MLTLTLALAQAPTLALTPNSALIILQADLHAGCREQMRGALQAAELESRLVPLRSLDQVRLLEYYGGCTLPLALPPALTLLSLPRPDGGGARAPYLAPIDRRAREG